MTPLEQAQSIRERVEKGEKIPLPDLILFIESAGKDLKEEKSRVNRKTDLPPPPPEPDFF